MHTECCGVPQTSIATCKTPFIMMEPWELTRLLPDFCVFVLCCARWCKCNGVPVARPSWLVKCISNGEPPSLRSVSLTNAPANARPAYITRIGKVADRRDNDFRYADLAC